MENKFSIMKINVLGDSHSLVFNHSKAVGYTFNVCKVDGATARGAINPNTKTDALNIYKDFLEKNQSDKLFIMLGEVDCGYLIWYKSKFEGLDPHEQMIESANRLFAFINEYALKYYKPSDIFVLGSNPPTIEDNANPEFLAGARSQVDTPLIKRLELTRAYNQELEKRCKDHRLGFISIFEDVLDPQTGKTNPKWLNEDPNDHHLSNKSIQVWMQKVKKKLPLNPRIKIIPFYGLRRSGNHAILEWMIHSMGTGKPREVLKHRRIMKRGTAVYFNESNTYESQNQLLFDVLLINKFEIENIITAYEDVNLKYELVPFTESKIVIIRDIENLVASRLKGISNGKLNLVGLAINQEFVNKWIEYAKAFDDPNYVCIKFEDWLTSKDVRDQFMQKLGFENLDKTDTITEFGNGSSFTGQNKDSTENLLNRSKQFEIPEDILKMIRTDEILELRKKLGYL